MISFKKYYQQQLTEDNILNIENLLLDLTDFDQESMKKDPTLTKWLRREVKKYVANTEFLNFPTVDQYLKDAPRANITDWYKTVPDGKLYVYNYACEDEMYKELKRKINIARDFYQSWTSLEKSKIIKMTLDHVIELYEEMKKQKLVEGKDFVVVMVFADEHKWVKLLTPLAFEIQGQKASN